MNEPIFKTNGRRAAEAIFGALGEKKFRSVWITTERFAGAEPIDVFHKELDRRELPKSRAQNCLTHFGTRINIGAARRVTMDISADDYYRLYVNGEFAAMGPAPAYHYSYNYNSVDITKYIREGENVIAVLVYYQGLINRVWNSGDNRQGMIADIYADGRYIGGTGGSWVCAEALEYSGSVFGYDTAFTENIDFRLKDTDWQNGVFSGGSRRPAFELPADDHRFRAEPDAGLEVRVIKPREIIRLAPGKYFLDFGREIVGVPVLSAKGRRGEKVTVICGEETESPHRARGKTRCGCDYEDVCVLSGGHDKFEFFDSKAFRYVNIYSDAEPDARTFCAELRGRRLEFGLTFVSDIKYLEKIWELCENTLRCGVQEGFLDCVSREKGQYLGDFTISGAAYMYLTGDHKSVRKTLFDFALSGAVCPGLLAVAPGSHMQEIADFSLQYPLQLLNYYRYTKDIKTLEALYPTVSELLGYFARFERGDGLLEGVNEKWNLVDWPAELRDGYEIAPCHNVLNAHYISAHRAADEIRSALGLPAEGRAERLSEAYINAFYDDGSRLFYDTEERSHAALHSNALAAFCGAVPAEAEETVKRFIISKGFSCGTQFSYFVLKGLSRLGAYAAELDLLVNESRRSWVNMLREGATACFEVWGKDQKHNCSLCHPWSCAPIIIIIEDLLKIPPERFECGNALPALSFDAADAAEL